MKKILTASLVAIMAVTAANADIASTKYVDDQTGVSADGTFGFEGVISGQTTLAGAVKKIAGELGTGGSVTTQITNALSTATADQFSESVKTSLAEADSAVQKSEVVTGTANGTISVQGSDVAVKGLGSAAYTESTAYDASGSAAQALADAKADATTKANAAQAAAEKTAGDALAAAKLELEGKITDAGADTTELAGRVDTIEKSAAYTSGIDSTKVAQIETNRTGVAANLASIQAINNEQTGILAQAKADATSKANTAESNAKAYAEEKASAAQTAAEKTAKDYTDAEVLKTTTALTEYKTSNDKAVADLTTELGKVQSGDTLAAGAVKLSNLDTAVQTSLAEADSAVQKSEVVTGTANGTISVQGSDVAVKGLGSAAYTEATAYDASGSAAQALADAKADAQAQVKSLKDTLTALATFPAACAEGTSDCALVIRSGTMQWEKVSY